MRITYLVNRVSENTDTVVALVDGEPMPVLVNTLEVELVDESGKAGSQCLRFRTQADKDAARAKYVEGTEITFDV